MDGVVREVYENVFVPCWKLKLGGKNGNRFEINKILHDLFQVSIVFMTVFPGFMW